MELVFVRHALPHRVELAEGPADPGLSPRGHRQAARAGALLAREALDAVVVSPLRRARETAEPLLAATGLSADVRDGIAEFDRHGSSYIPVEELRAANDPRWQRLARGELYGDDPEGPPAGDGGKPLDVAEFRRRVIASVEEVVAAHPGGRVALVSHAGVINAYTAHVLGIARDLWFSPAYVSVTRVGAARGGRRGLVSLNETGHVRDLL